jgi:lipopolysaccharide export system protein LptA
MIERLRFSRIAACALVAGGAFWLGQPLSAAPAKAYNNNAPVNYSADRIEVQDKSNRVVLTGNVDVVQDTMRLRAARVTVSYTNDGSLKIQQMIATGSVFVTRSTTDSARGDVAVYDIPKRIITMSGHVMVDRSGDTLNGGRAVINLATGQSTVDGRSSGATSSAAASGGRVSGTFSVAKGK